MRNRFKLLIPFTLVIIAGALESRAFELIANFDSYMEGPIGTSFADGGITFSDLDVALEGGPFSFIIEDASASTWPQLSKPNFLGGTGYFNGPGFGLSRFRAMTVTLPRAATSAAFDVFATRQSNHKFLTVTAFFQGVIASTLGVWLDQGIVLDNFADYHAIIITAPALDKVTFQVTNPAGALDFSLLGVDNVRATVIPEPSAIALAVIGMAAFSLRRHHSCPMAE